MNNSDNTLTSIKLSLQVELPILPDKFGVFDSFGATLVNKSLKINFLERHLKRFNQGLELLASALNKPLTSEMTLSQLQSAIKSAFKNKDLSKVIFGKSNSIRFRLWSNISETWLIAAPFVSRYKNTSTAKLITCDFNREIDFKYTPATESINSHILANNNHSNEGLLINPSNFVTEASWSNFFWISTDERIHSTGYGLRGITQQILYQLNTAQNQISVESIEKSDLLEKRPACFITNALEGVVAIGMIDGIKMNYSSQIEDIKRCYNDYCSNNEVTWIPVDF